MPLALVVEDGTGLASATSYVTIDATVAYNAQRDVEIDSDPDVAVPLIMSAMDFIETYEYRWYGDRAFPLYQALSWPRMNVNLFGNCNAPLLSTTIPYQLKNAVMYLAGVALTVDLYAVQDTRAITKEVIGPLETDYSTTAGATVRPMIPNLDGILLALLKQSVGTLRSLRI